MKMSTHQPSDGDISLLLSPPKDKNGNARLYTSDEHERLFSIDPAQLERVQLSVLQQRFAALSPQLPSLKKLADENCITAINTIDELVPLLFPHTVYKSYPLSFIDNCRFAQLNEWLNNLTTYDLSGLDVSGCQSIDEWLDVVEANTPVRVMASSGTSGKISLVPKSMVEENCLLSGYSTAYVKFRDESGIENYLASDFYHVLPFARHSRHSTGLLARAVVRGFQGDESHVLTPGGEMSTDLLWLTGRMKKAQAEGTMEQLKKTKAWQRLNSRLTDLQTRQAESQEGFFNDVLTKLKNKKVFLLMGLNYLWAMLECAEKSGNEIGFAPGSVVSAAGGKKWDVLTDEQKEEVWKAIPFVNVEAYGFSEILNGVARKCSAGHYHQPPWVVHYVLDPDTGVPYPRKGVKTGRGAAFDLWAQTYWGGFISSDEVTMNWDGGCSCGRVGAFLHGDVTRYTDKHGGDDKITCQRTASAVAEMMEQMND